MARVDLKEEDVTKERYERKSVHDLRQLALCISSDQAFGSWQLTTPDLLHTVFLPLRRQTTIHAKAFAVMDIVHYYGMMTDSITEAGTLPVFVAMRYLDRQDFDALMLEIARLNDFVGEGS